MENKLQRYNYIMKRKIFLLMLMLGMMVSTASCGTMGYYRADGSVRQYAQDDVIYRNGRITYNGTRIVGDRGCPMGIYWANAAITRWGMVVKVLNKDGEVIKTYDLRIPRQQVEDTFYVNGLTGKPLEVEVYIRGRYATVTVRGGDESEHYSLYRD